MNFGSLCVLLAMGPPPGTQSNPTGELLRFGGIMAFMFVAIYFLSIAPQRKKTKEHAELLKALKVGDKILTSGGILGTVVGVKEKSLSIRSADTKLEILKSAVAEITEKSSSGNGS